MKTPPSAPTAVIMAGGKGHRMHPFTNAMPKALLPIGTTIMMDVIVSAMAEAGCREVVVSLGHLAPLIRTYCTAHKGLRLPIRFVEETSPLGTAGALSLLDPRPETVIVINCDVLSDVKFGDVIREHHECGADVTILGVPHKYKLPYGILEADGEGTLSAWREGPEHRYTVAGGAYVVSNRAIGLIKHSERVDMPTLVERVIQNGWKVHVYSHNVAWFDLGTIDSYNQGVAMFNATPERFGFKQ